MNRYEENIQLIKSLNCNISANYQQADILLKGKILEVLADISKSLAIIADEKRKRAEAEREGEE